jgi:formylglycine-generating enzyme required for sulfatase activity
MKWFLAILFTIVIIAVIYIIFPFVFPHKSILPEMEFVYVSGGSFMMGPSPAEAKSSIDKAKRRNTNVRPFYIMTTEVTQKQWKSVMGNNSSHFKGDSLPVDNVSWNDVQEFIQKLNNLDAVRKFRLPSEAEWEFACRAGTTTLLYSGDKLSDLDRVGWYRANSNREPHQIGLKEPNALGLYDMHGNVREWCQDIYAVEDDSSFRAIRGGSWLDLSKNCRSSYRSRQNMRVRSNCCGFRLASNNFEDVLYQPIDPTPLHKAQDLSNITSISWSSVNPDNDTLMYDVYFGTEPDPPLVQRDYSETTYMLNNLDYETTYYWKIISKSKTGDVVEGSIWGFVTSTRPGEECEFELGASNINISMIRIPPGNLKMGPEDGRDVGDLKRGVTISNWFWLGKCEVTQKQWKAVMGNNPAKDFGVGGDYPVYYVSLEDIYDFISRLNRDDVYSSGDSSPISDREKHARIFSENRPIWIDEPFFEDDRLWRLPSEAEWEYACRLESSTRFSWSDDPLCEEITDHAWFTANSSNRTHPVGLKKPNHWGLFDMSGNVSELCEDVWHPADRGFMKNGQAWISETNASRVIRGGCWDSQPLECSSFSRKPHQGHRSNMVGFRLVRTR